MATAETGQRVISCAAIVLGDLPLGSNQVLTFEAVERGIQRSLPQLEDVLRPLFDAFGDAPSMHRLELQRLEHQHVEGPLQDVAFFGRHVVPFDRRKKRSVRSFRLSRGTANRRRYQRTRRRRAERPASSEVCRAPISFVVVENWFEELKRLVPTK